MRLGDANSIQFLLRSAINDYEHDKTIEARSKLTEIVESGQPADPQVFEYLYLICKYDEPSDLEEAKEWSKKYVARIEELAIEGDVSSRLKLASMLQFGDRVPVDHLRARKMLAELADQKCGEAQYHLAVMYKHGHCDLQEDLDLYFQWLESAANNGFPDAQYDLANLILSQDKTASEDNMKARLLLLKSAKAGFRLSEVALAKMEKKES